MIENKSIDLVPIYEEVQGITMVDMSHWSIDNCCNKLISKSYITKLESPSKFVIFHVVCIIVYNNGNFTRNQKLIQ